MACVQFDQQLALLHARAFRNQVEDRGAPFDLVLDDFLFAWFNRARLGNADRQPAFRHCEEWDILLDIVPAHDILAALESGQIDAGHTWEPTKSAALEKGYVILGTAGDTPGIISDVLAFDSQIIKQRPEDIQAIIRSLSEAKDFLDNNRQEALEIMANAEGMSIEEMDEGTNGVHILSLQENIAAMKQSKDMTSLYTSGEAIINFYLHRGQLFHKPDLNDIIEPRFINNIAGAE